MSEFKSNFKQLNLLLWKNYALQKRSVIGTILELLLPAFFAIILLPIRGIVKSKDNTNSTIYTPYLTDLLPPGFIPTQEPFVYYNRSGDSWGYKSKASSNVWCLGYTPANDTVAAQVMNALNPKFNIQSFVSENDMVDYVTSGLHYHDCLGGITFMNTSSTNFTYKIRMSYSPRNSGETSVFKQDYDWKTNLLYSLFPVLGPRDKGRNDGGDPGYYREGFLTLQKNIDTQLINQFSANVSSILVYLDRFPYPPYNDDNFVLVIQALFPFIIMLSFVFTVILTAKAITYEKETGIKEAMKLMGMKPWIYWLSWYIKTLILVAPAVLFMVISFKVKVPLKGGGHAAILNQTNPLILALFFFLYLTSSITFTFLTTTFFKKANSAAAGSGIIWFLTYLPYIFISLRYQKMSLNDKLFACFVNNLGMSEAVQLIGMFEGKGVGVQWSNINEGISVDDNFTFLQVLIILFANNFIHLILLYYFEKISPGDHGIAKVWYFPIYALFPKLDEQYVYKKKFEGKVINEIDTGDEATNQTYIENETPYAARKVGIQIKGLNKIFKQFGKYKQAVNDLSLNIYENHITVLLGHNGAGKSTTISMITGICEPTSGRILVDNHDIITETKEARAELGYCPQHNLLFNDLTVYEHLMFFSKLKNNFDHDEIVSMLESLNLTEKMNSKANVLSGGQKRKLCVAIAFIGKSKIVILDEPTSGMDPQARHSIWSILQKFKKEKNCSILLTTHFMDEADCLGDRIAIMSRGKLRCSGSPLFLKSVYGSGYNLILTRSTSGTNRPNISDTDSTGQLTALITKHINNARLNSEISSEISFILPKEESSKFPALLLDLETNKEALSIVNIGISITTVEDVFLKIGELENVDERDINGVRSPINGTSASTAIADKARVSLIQDVGDEEGATSGSIDDNIGLWVGSSSADRVQNKFKFYYQQFMALLVKRMIHSLRNKVLVISQIIVPFATLIIVLLYVQFGPIKPEDSPILPINFARYRQNYIPYQVVADTNDSFVAQLAANFEREFKTVNNAKVFSLLDNTTVSLCAENRLNIDDFLVCVAKYSLSFINDNYLIGATFQQIKNDISIISHFNNQPYHVPPLALNSITNTLFKFYSNNRSNTINVINHPLPRNIDDKITDLKLKDSTGFNVATDLTFGFAFLISSFVVFLVKERVSGSKHIQYLSGVNAVIFWTSALLWDFLNFLIPTAISIGIIWAFGINQYIDGGRVLIVIGLFLLYGLAHIPQAYLMSYLFTVPATGFAVTVAWNILSSQATLTAVGILQLPMLELQYVADLLEWIFLVIFPNFAFGQAMTDLYNNYEAVQVCEQLITVCDAGQPNPCCIGYNNIKPSPCFPGDCLDWTENYMAWRRPGLLRFFVFLPLQFIVQFAIILLHETGVLRRIRYKIKKLLSGGDSEMAELVTNINRLEIERLYGDIPKDDDVINEEKRIFELNPNQSDELLVIDNLTKYYGSFMAVKGMSLGIRTGETFGLLGVNGAGKTSTFKMLTGDETITKGNAYLNKTSIKESIKRFQQQLGYCPQFDPLIDQMTTMETLVMFARLRGIKQELISSLCHSLINLLDLQDHTGKMCFTLSGGNKRKLSVAISLIGSPAIVLLDEPTSGMDPKTRRFLWNCLNKIRNRGKSLILTSHSMDETEALCTRLGIMVNGELKCLGSLQTIKSRYGEGYTLLVKLTLDKLTQENVQEFVDFILRTFQNSTMKECRDGFVNIHFNDNSIRMLANIFSLIESIKTKYEIEYYIVTQTKLEQIFLNFASRQIDPLTRYLVSSGCCSSIKWC